MVNLYHFLFKIFLAIPIIGVLNSTFLNKYFKIQKAVNNVVYIGMAVLCAYILILYSAYGKYDLALFGVSKNIPIVFSVNSFNIVFGLFIAIIVVFFNLVFQNSFNFLKLLDKYSLYNKQISYLYMFYIWICFSNNMLISTFIYSLIMMYSYLFITNPDLREFRKNYEVVFSTTSISNIILMILLAFFYSAYGQSLLFTVQNAPRLASISMYWLVATLFFLVCVNYCGSIYTIFRERFYYEDLLPIFVIYVIPFMFFNTFLFIKVVYYIFFKNLSNIGLYFYYCGFAVAVLFLVSCFFCFKHIKNTLKFLILFCILNFLIFLSQMLFVVSELELVRILVNFSLFLVSVILAVLSYSGMLFLLLHLDITEISLLYKKSKIQINFYIFCLLTPIMMNLISFFDLNFHNMNILYWVNLLEILTAFGLYGGYVFLLLRKKAKTEATTIPQISGAKKVKFFFPQIILLIFFAFLILLKTEIVRFMVRYI